MTEVAFAAGCVAAVVLVAALAWIGAEHTLWKLRTKNRNGWWW